MLSEEKEQPMTNYKICYCCFCVIAVFNNLSL